MFFASCVFFVLSFCLAPMLWAAGSSPTPNAPLTVLIDFEAPHSDDSLQSLRQSLNRILNPGGIDVNVEIQRDMPEHSQFGELVIFKMRGSCSMGPAPSLAKLDRTGPLALAYTSDGQVLHFGEVECDRIRQSLQRVLGSRNSPKNEKTYGMALAVVMAHEVYHMLGNATKHTKDGLTKPALSASELTGSLNLPQSAINAMTNSLRHQLQ